jgi:hypothetical protein
MFSQLIDRFVPRANLPKLSIAQRVIDKIVGHALVYQTETGEVLAGFATEAAELELYVLDTIAPDESAVRGAAYFEQGDAQQEDIFNWWADNWQLYRQQGKDADGVAIAPAFNRELAFLGNWHKHPGDLTRPSGGDLNTALNDLADEGEMGMAFTLVFLATVWKRTEADLAAAHPSPDAYEDEITTDEAAPTADEKAGQQKYLLVGAGDNHLVRIDFWFISRQRRRFVRLVPSILANTALPALPEIGWHLAQPARMTSETLLLQKAGYSVKFTQYAINSKAPLAVCCWMWRQNSPHIIFIVTQPNFPDTPPQLRLTPVAALSRHANAPDLFQALWAESTPMPEANYPAWAVGDTLANFVAQALANYSSSK